MNFKSFQSVRIRGEYMNVVETVISIFFVSRSPLTVVVVDDSVFSLVKFTLFVALFVAILSLSGTLDQGRLCHRFDEIRPTRR